MIENIVLSIGAAKSGTTSLNHYLCQHPEIVGSRPKEPNFFGSEENWNKGTEWYEGLWEWDPSQHRFALESSNHYAMWPSFTRVFQRIKSLTDRYDFKFLYCLRHPVDRIESHLTHASARRWDHWRFSENHVVPICEVLNVSRYALQLDEFLRHFPREQIHLVDFDRLVAEPRQVVEETLDFIGADSSLWEFSPEPVHSRSTERVGYPPGWGALKDIRPIQKLVTSAVPPAVRKKLFVLLGRSVDRVRLSPEEKRLLWGTLKPDIERLQSEWGFDTSAWEPPASWESMTEVRFYQYTS